MLHHEGMGQVHSRCPTAASTSENLRTTRSTVRVCRVHAITNCDGWTRMPAFLSKPFFLLFFYCFHFSCLDVGVWDACAVSRGYGAGTYTLLDGDKYVGEFKGGKRHGQGMSCVRGDKLWQMDSDACSPLDALF